MRERGKEQGGTGSRDSTLHGARLDTCHLINVFRPQRLRTTLTWRRAQRWWSAGLLSAVGALLLVGNELLDLPL
eukprot:961711-Rhodomonas_salina.2